MYDNTNVNYKINSLKTRLFFMAPFNNNGINLFQNKNTKIVA